MSDKPMPGMNRQPKPEVWWNPMSRRTLTYMYGSAAGAPVGAVCVFPAPDRDAGVVREIAVKWAPPFDRDEPYPWIILGSEGPQRLSNDSVDDCEWLPFIRPSHEYGMTAELSGNALEVIAAELRRLNEGRDQWYREVLEVLTAAKSEDVAPLRCDICGKPGHVPRCLIGPLSREQWKTHYASLYQRCMDNGGYQTEAHRQAATKMRDLFGPCPEES